LIFAIATYPSFSAFLPALKTIRSRAKLNHPGLVSAAAPPRSVHVGIMMAGLLELPERMLWSLLDWARSTPIYVLLVLFIVLIVVAFTAVSLKPVGRLSSRTSLTRANA
jgi:hypothetical protein